MKLNKINILFILFFLSNQLFANTPTFNEIKQRGFLKCGVSQSLAGFSYPDDNGNWTGLDVDVCRAVATAIFKDPTKVKFTPLSAKERFTALQSGEIDLLSRNTTWTFSRDATQGIEFTNITYYDGQGFMVPKQLNIKSPLELNGATVCTNSGTTTELNTADYFRKNNITFKMVTFEKADEVVAAYNSGRCDVYTTDRSALAAQRIKLSRPNEHIILPDIISKEPLSTAVRQGDSHFADLVRWVFYGILTAEEYSINSKNINDKLKSTDPAIHRLLGIQSTLGKLLYLDENFMVPVIKHIGNYQEIFDRNLGKNSKLNLNRGLNKLWNNGGIMYAPPFR